MCFFNETRFIAVKRSIVWLIALAGLAWAGGHATAAIPGAGVRATLYIVNVKKMELCPNVACASPFVIANSTRAFDIAAVTVGAAVGSYANTNNLPAGQTFSHVRMTMDEQITISGSGTDAGANCFTGTPAIQGDFNTAEVKAAGGAPAVAEIYVVPARAGDFVALTAADFTAINVQDRTVSGDVVVLFPLTAPFTVGATAPSINVAFGTQTALGVQNAGGGNCAIFPRPPTVSITVS